MKKVRVDKWLWSVRIFKSRTIATDACKSGKVRIGDDTLKPSQLIEEGQTITVRKNGFNLEFKVLQLLEKRVGAPIAVTCYEEVTPEAERNKYESWFLNAKRTSEMRERGSGRPTKKDRREIEEFKQWWDEDED
ncbi:MAG: RNA-binding S4 domain-containing protein [Saprospiraceae bacterium]|jgi:ribosome-associated heat shock protein Hsp15